MSLIFTYIVFNFSIPTQCGIWTYTCTPTKMNQEELNVMRHLEIYHIYVVWFGGFEKKKVNEKPTLM